MLSDIEQYLPKYLSKEQQAQLFEELDQFPDNIHKRLYSDQCDGDAIILQGDGLSAMPIVELPSASVLDAAVMIISNTCDIQPDNTRAFPTCVSYCPLIRLEAYHSMLIKVHPGDEERIQNHIDSLRRQECSSMFYLPPGLRLKEERIALLDRLCHHRADSLDFPKLLADRLFSLSDYGFYLFLFKISVHFTRLREAIVRGYSEE